MIPEVKSHRRLMGNSFGTKFGGVSPIVEGSVLGIALTEEPRQSGGTTAIWKDDRVEISDGVVHVTACREAGAVREAAAIWAHARAYRDQMPEPSTVEETEPGILRRLSIDGAKLLLARRNDQAVGFTLFAPRTQTLEIFYLAVAPDSWGDGVGSFLLVSAENHARNIGREMLELWVITDNERAISVYERSGFVGTQEVKRDTPSGRLERRFLKEIQ